MLIHIYGIPDTISLDERKALRDKIQSKVAEILNITKMSKPIFVEVIPPHFSDSAGLFAQVHIDTKETEAQTKKTEVEEVICVILREFATTNLRVWMVGAFSTVQDFHLSELEY
jgi:murein endopeptidase